MSKQFLLIMSVLTFSWINGQELTVEQKPAFQFKNGLGVIAPDSSFSLNFRFRMQSRVNYVTNTTDDWRASQIEARIRRMRLRFEGFVVDPKLTYYVQLSFSRGDMDWDVRDISRYNSSPNIVRDAVITYKPTKRFSVLFGQTKLPGNRQRVNSSGELQFADRSIVNSALNIDRDFGVQTFYNGNINKFNYVLRGAISSGEGRNSNVSDGGLAYTGRLELLPLGAFTNKGDYFEGDLEREKSPKISLAAGYHFNDKAYRNQGTLGKDLYEQRDLKAFIADMMLKYNGFAFVSEYLNRRTPNPITSSVDGKTAVVLVGQGYMSQASYIFKNNVEIATRFAVVTPYDYQLTKAKQNEEMGIGVTKYLKKHRVKLQGNLFYLRDKDMNTGVYGNERWSVFTQIELGI